MTVCVDCPAASPRKEVQRDELLRDPSFPIAARMLERHPDYREAARLCPDLAAQPPLDAAAHCNVVLIHGGLSNGLACFGDSLMKDGSPLLSCPGINVFRYEHDTWLPIECNVVELVSLVRQKLRGHRLLLIGFSRGGIVATRAAARLRELGAVGGPARPADPGMHRDVSVMTFGSPHRGFRTSDVVQIFPRLGYCFQFQVSTAIDRLPARQRFAIFVESWRRLSRLPPGIAETSPRNPELDRFIRSPAGRWIEPRLRAYGGSPPEPKRLPRWCRALLSRPVPGIGDGAVSLSSATAYGAEREEVRGCGHDDYFFRPDVHAAIARCLAAVTPFSASPATSPAAS